MLQTSMPWTFSFMWSSLVVFPSFLFFQQYPSFLYFTFFLLYRTMLPFFGLTNKSPDQLINTNNRREASAPPGRPTWF